MNNPTYPVKVSKLTAKAIKEAPEGIHMYSKGGNRFVVSVSTSWNGEYVMHHLSQGTLYYCNSLADIKEWLSLN